MTPYCDRCGREMPPAEAADPAAKLEAGRLVCSPCRLALPPRPPGKRKGTGSAAPALAALLVAGLAGWIGVQLIGIEARLKRMEAGLRESPVPGPPALSPEESEALARLKEHPPAPAAELGALREEVARLREVLRIPGIPAAMAPLPLQTEAPPRPAPEPPAAPAPAPAPPTPALEEALGRDLASSDPMARYQALALAQASQAPAAVRLLQDEMGFVRRGAAEALGRLKLAEAAPALLAMARREQDLLARRAALEALERITGLACLDPAGGEADALSRCEAWCAARKGAAP